MPTITNATLAAIAEQVDRRNGILQKFINEFTPTSWANVLADVRAGKAKQRYAVGDELIGSYVYNGQTYDCPWVVLDNDRECEWEDGTKHPGLWLGMKYCTPEDIQFDAKEGEEATEETAQAGVYYCGFNESTYTMLNLSAGDAIPYGSYTTVYKGAINNKDVYQYGYNRYRDSAIRQWLNSDGAVGEWWEPTHIGDAAPSQLGSRPGFIAGLPNDFLAVVQKVKYKASANTVTDGGAEDILCDKFFLQSLEEVYGSPQIPDVEGPYFPYWKIITGMSEPSNGSSTNTNPARKIPRLTSPTGSAAYVRLRSAYRGYAGYAWIVYSTGYLSDGSSAYNSYASLPACVIS